LVVVCEQTCSFRVLAADERQLTPIRKETPLGSR
jgi:hypothetical protein